MADNQGIKFDTVLNNQEWKLWSHFHNFGALPGVQYPIVGNLIVTKLIFEQAMTFMMPDFEKFVLQTSNVSLFFRFYLTPNF